MNELIDRKEILTRDEVMESLKIGRSTFYKLIHDGKLKGYKDGNKLGVDNERILWYNISSTTRSRIK